MIHTVDFDLFDRAVVFDYFTRLCENNEIAGCMNKTLVSSIKTFISDMEKQDKYTQIHIDSAMSEHMTLEQIKLFTAFFKNKSDEGVLAARFQKENHDDLN